MSKVKPETRAKQLVQQAETSRMTKELQASNSDMIAEAAYYKAEKRGFVPGYEIQDWLEAETEINENIVLH